MASTSTHADEEPAASSSEETTTANHAAAPAAEAAPTTVVTAAEAVAFLRRIGPLKQLHRTGWVNRHIPEPETVSDHMYRMAMMALLADGSLVSSPMRVMQMALVHDIAECIVGDITPDQQLGKKEKYHMEREAMATLGDLVGNKAPGAHIRKLWAEYEDGTSDDAKFVKDLDRFDMVLTAHEYEQLHGADLEEFFASVRGKLKTPQVRGWMQVLEQQRRDPQFQPVVAPPKHHAPRRRGVVASVGAAWRYSRGFVGGVAVGVVLCTAAVLFVGSR